MPRLLQDTIFAALVRAVLGPTYFPHIDEKRAIHLSKSSSATLEARTSDSENSESSGELSNPGKGETVKEEGTDSTLVTWYGPDDPEVCQGYLSFHTKLIYS
jgi:hypothetical protein